MKRLLILIAYFFATGFILFCNVNELQTASQGAGSGGVYLDSQGAGLDSAGNIPQIANDTFNGIWNLAVLLTGGGNFIPFLPNSILYMILSFVVGLIFRRYEKNKLRKSGVLIDTQMNPPQEKPGFLKRLFKRNPA